MNHLKSGMESLLRGEGLSMMDSKDTYRNSGDRDENYEDQPEGEYSDKPELPSYEALIEMIGLDNIYAMMESKNNMSEHKEQSLMQDDYVSQ